MPTLPSSSSTSTIVRRANGACSPKALRSGGSPIATGVARRSLCASLGLREIGSGEEPLSRARGEREAESRTIGHDDLSVAELDALLEQRIEPVEPLHPAFARLACREVDVKLRREMRRDRYAELVSEIAHAPVGRDTTDPHRVRLNDIHRVCLEEASEIRRGREHLASGDRRVERVTERGMSFDVVRVKGLLDPGEVVLLETPPA